MTPKSNNEETRHRYISIAALYHGWSNPMAVDTLFPKARRSEALLLHSG
jgi:hypothetical protein